MILLFVHCLSFLLLQNIGITDAGVYECVAQNSKGEASRSTEVVVRRQTQIRQAPADLTVTAGTQAKFVCTALTYPDEAGVSISSSVPQSIR